MELLTNDIAKLFASQSSHMEIQPVGNGLINDTFLVKNETGQMILQKINTHVFQNPIGIIENLQKIQLHIREKFSTAPLIIPSLLPTSTGNYFHYELSDNTYWRALEYIHPSQSREQLTYAEEAHATGKALAQFHWMLDSINPETLEDTLPGFHITPKYLEQFHQCLSITKINQSSDAFNFCLEFIEENQAQANLLENAKKQGVIKSRVIHGDPKLNNFLFHPDTNKIKSLIDLDTVKPGLIQYDIGDCIRSCCHCLSDNSLNELFCHAILKSYLEEARPYLSQHDFDFLYPSIWLIPFELGIRFLTDHLQGNVYFKTSETKQNLHRAYAQFQLCKDIQLKKHSIETMIDSLR